MQLVNPGQRDIHKDIQVYARIYRDIQGYTSFMGGKKVEMQCSWSNLVNQRCIFKLKISNPLSMGWDWIGCKYWCHNIIFSSWSDKGKYLVDEKLLGNSRLFWRL